MIARFRPCSTFTQAIRFFGHGMGALVSFELVRLLRKQYDTLPVHLFVSAHHAPQIPDLDEPIHALGEPAFKEELRYLNGTPETVLENTELMQLLIFLEETFNICSGYFDCTKACQLH